MNKLYILGIIALVIAVFFIAWFPSMGGYGGTAGGYDQTYSTTGYVLGVVFIIITIALFVVGSRRKKTK